MARYILLTVISLVCMATYGVGQKTVSCGEVVKACPGEVVYFDFGNLFEGGIESFKVPWVGNAVDELLMIREGVYSYRFEKTIASDGYIDVIGVNGEACEIVLRYDETCRLKLTLPDHCLLPLEEHDFSCEPDDDLFPAYCIGDTITGLFSSKNRDQEVYFDTHYIELIGGEIVHSTPSTIDIVWQDLGLAYINYSDGFTWICGFANILPSVENKVLASGKDVSRVEVCTGEVVQVSMSSPVDSPLWETSEGATHTTSSVELSFSTPGEHWIATVDNSDCLCAPPDTLFIDVVGGDIPGITCVGPICLGDSTTYYSKDLCSSYVWDISAEGTIVSGGGMDDSFVEVRWDSGSKGAVSLTTPGCSSNQCKSTAVSLVPIVSLAGVISGPDTVCAGDLSTFILEGAYSTQNLSWSLDQHGRIQSYNDNGVLNVQWSGFTGVIGQDLLTARLSVEYEDCLLNCRGRAEKDIVILPDVYPYQVPNLCLGNYVNVHTNNFRKVDWVLVSPSGKEIVANNSNRITHVTDETGEYTLIMKPRNTLYCGGIDTSTFHVHPLPDPIYTLDIDSLLCLNHEQTYTAENKENGDVIIWEIYDGDTLRNRASIEGHTLKYRWESSGPYRLAAKVRSVHGCESFIERNDLIGERQIIMKDTSCVWSAKSYSVDKVQPSSFIDWEIVPPSAGSIVELSDASVRVAWKDVDASLIARGCNTVTRFDVHLVNDPIQTDLKDTVCHATTYDLHVNDANLHSIRITTPFGDEVSTSAQTLLDPGRYKVFCESKSGCSSYSEIEIAARKNPNRTIVPDIASFSFCEATVTAFGLTVSGGIEGDTYTWYHDNVKLPATTRKILVSRAGTYRVEVVNTHGCPGDVLDIEFFNCCETISVVNPSPPLTVRQRDEDCYTKSFWVEPVKPGVSYFFDLGDGTFAQGDTVRHTYTKAGSYNIIAQSDENCVKIDTIICGKQQSLLLCPKGRALVNILMVSDFSFKENCQGTKHELINNTTKIHPTLSVDYVWDFGDPSSGMNTSTLENPTYVFDESKTYTVTLTATDPSGCVSTTTKDITPIASTYVNVSTASEICLNAPLELKDEGASEPLEYLWDFGDGTLLTDPSTHVSPTTHMYDTPGTYDVILTSINDDGCRYKDTTTVTVVSNTFSGNIMPDAPNPVCPEDEVVLRAPTGQSYRWNTGETTQEITAYRSDEYKVAVTDEDGCIFTIPGYSVARSYDRPLSIIGFTKGPNNEEVRHSDSLVICQGSYVELQVDAVPNYSYLWNNSSTSHRLDFASNFSSLPVGRHVYSVDASNASILCKAPIDPFVIHVVPHPQTPIITTIESNPCSGKKHILTVQNSEPGVEYVWSNGQLGNSIETSLSGRYSVTARRSSACAKESNIITIMGTPSLTTWHTGCFEACFPHQLCVDLNNRDSYELVKDGVSIKPIATSVGTIDLDEPGEYQLKIVTADGCESITEPLSIDAVPENHSVSGIVFYDENENGIYDGVDELLDSIPVFITLGNTTVYDTLSSTGQYHFDTLGYTRLHVSIDPSSSELNLHGITDTMLTFDSCVQNLKIDFPLTTMCPYIEDKVEFKVCSGDSVLYDGSYYYASDQDTFRFLTKDLCDSLVVLNVLEAPESRLKYTTSGSCVDEANGSVDIHVAQGEIAMVLIEGKEVDISSPIVGLASGTYTMMGIDTVGCQSLYQFTIPEFQKPVVSLETDAACNEGSLGQLRIRSDLSSGMRYSLDGVEYSDKEVWEDLPTADYTLYARDTNGCEQKIDFKIEAISSPIVAIDPKNTCPGSQTGVATITSDAGAQLMYSLDKEGPFTAMEKIESLAQGEYMLYILDENGCISSSAFEINAFDALSLDIEALESCPEQGDGRILIHSKNYYWSLDRDGVYQAVESIENLKKGTYTAYAIDGNNCRDSIEVVIDIHTIDSVQIVSTNACDDMVLGSIMIQGVDGMSYSLDGNAFSQEIPLVDYKPGAYILYAKDANACVQETPFEIGMTERPVYELVSEGTCIDQMNGVIHIKSLDSLYLSFNGFPYDTVRTFSNLSPDTYEVNFVVDACTYRDSVAVAQYDLPIITVRSTKSCVNSGTGTIELDKENETDLIVFEGNAYPAISTFKELMIGEYAIEVRNIHGCSSREDVKIEALPELKIETDSVPNCLSSPIEITPRILSSAGTVEYTWSSGSTEPSELGRTDGVLSVQIGDDCMVQDVQWDLNFEQNLSAGDLPMPNIFSPNQDGVNDCFLTSLPSYITVEKYEQLIFDRWGTLVFSSDDIHTCWKGEYMGQPAEPGVYVHITKIWTRDCAGIHLIEKIGDLTVLR